MADLAGASTGAWPTSRARSAGRSRPSPARSRCRSACVGVELSKGGEGAARPGARRSRSLLQVLVRAAQKQDADRRARRVLRHRRRPQGAAGLLRTELQHHYQVMGLVFAGSQPSTMRCCSPTRRSRSSRRPTWSRSARSTDAGSSTSSHDGFEPHRPRRRADRPAGGVDSPTAIRSGRCSWPMRAGALVPVGGAATDDDVGRRARGGPPAVDSGSERLYTLLRPATRRCCASWRRAAASSARPRTRSRWPPGTAQAAVEGARRQRPTWSVGTTGWSWSIRSSPTGSVAGSPSDERSMISGDGRPRS